MFLFHNHKIIYSIVPGTGSNSFHRSYKESNEQGTGWEQLKEYKKEIEYKKARNINPEIGMYQHWTLEQMREFLPSNTWNTYKKIIFVREPYAWLESMYNKGGGVQHSVGINNSGTYEEYIKGITKTPYFWAVDKQGNMLADEIWRTEDLEKISLNLDIPYKHLNKTKSKPNHELTDELKEIIQQKFHKEFKHYT